jgi:hypothetical protein
MAVALRDFDHGERRPRLRVVPPPAAPPRSVFWLRRALLLAVVIGLLVAAVVAVRAMAAGSDEPVARTNLTVVVAPGQTLWDLAERYAPEDRDLVDWADEIARLNGVDAQALQSGTPLVIPLETAAVSADPAEGPVR